MKCLPLEKVKMAKGNILHDSHAEVLAIRGFNRWLVDECADLAKRGFRDGKEGEGEWVRWRRRGGEEEREELGADGKSHEAQESYGRRSADEPLFELQDDVELHMCCSEAPCGDASMELVMREQEDDTPWQRPPPDRPTGQDSAAAVEDEAMLGRGYFDRLGVVRRKPARSDAPVALSKSCSDKLALNQCTGLLSAITARLVGVKGTWLKTLVLPQERIVEGAVGRCFGPTGRMAPLSEEAMQEKWRGLGFAYSPFVVRGTEREFEYARPSHTRSGAAFSSAGDQEKAEPAAPAAVPSNLSTVITPHKQEILINGVLQGRVQSDPRGASCVSRRRMWEALRNVHRTLGMMEGESMGLGQTYGEMKMGARVLRGREKVKGDVRGKALKRWKRSIWDEGWRLEED